MPRSGSGGGSAGGVGWRRRQRRREGGAAVTTTAAALSSAKSGGLIVQDVNYTPVGAGVTVLDRVNLTLQPTGLNLIVGRSGFGKSTLLSLVAGLAEPTAGRARGISVDGGTHRHFFSPLQLRSPPPSPVCHQLAQDQLHCIYPMRLPPRPKKRKEKESDE